MIASFRNVASTSDPTAYVAPKAVVVGEVTIGALFHGSTVGNQALIGMDAIVLDGAGIADDCLIGAVRW